MCLFSKDCAGPFKSRRAAGCLNLLFEGATLGKNGRRLKYNSHVPFSFPLSIGMHPLRDHVSEWKESPSHGS